MNDTIRNAMIDLAAMTDDGRERYMTPWSSGQYSYATDNKMAIRADGRDEFHQRPENDKSAATLDAIVSSATGQTWYAVPANLPAAPGPCPKCHGVPAVKCEACDGEGEVEWEFEYNGRTYDMDADCPVCGGEGAEECSRCGGKGTGDDPAVEVGPALIRADYLRLLARLPGCRLAPVDGWGPVVFEFDGGTGAVMPMRR